ncbi:MAG: ECF-type sigma factor [Planctomycetota bacterium]|jgi:RNA polymerase sigma factor (TIGR02999 family)
MTTSDGNLPASEGPGSDRGSADDLMPIVYEQLQTLAAKYLQHEKSDQILEPEVLVNEAYLKLADNPPGSWTGVDHFLAVAARAMRRILIDHARRRRALKRGFGRAEVSLELVTLSGPRDVDIRVLDEALEVLTSLDPKASQVVELRFFAGLTHEQASRVMGVSRKTVVEKWQRARDWLAEELAEEAAEKYHAAAQRKATG